MDPENQPQYDPSFNAAPPPYNPYPQTVGEPQYVFPTSAPQVAYVTVPQGSFPPPEYGQPQPPLGYNYPPEGDDTVSAFSIITLVITLAGVCCGILCCIGFVMALIGVKDKNQNAQSKQILEISLYLGGFCTAFILCCYFILFFILFIGY
jgi:hypothetical protein